MTAWLASTYHPTRLAGRDLRARARALAGDRKVFRMLDELSIPPFVAALEAWDEAGTVASPARTAIFTVSAWEPDVPALDGAPDEPWEARIRYYQQQALPSQMLRSMPNSTLCHVAIAAGFRGPNAHYVGDGASVGQVLQLARIELDAGTADAVVVATFDEEPAEATAGRRVVAAACVLSAAPVSGAAPVRIPAREAWGGASPTAALVSWFDRVDRVEGAA